MTDSAYRIAPPGFTDDEWETFNREGILFFEDALDQAAVDELTAAVDRVCQSSPKYRAGETFGCQNIVERDPAFAALIDHPRHIGYAYDFFGELLKLHQSQFFIRPPGGERYNLWHPDGARAVPYGTFSPELPLQIKIGFWLTDLPRAKMGNLVVLPGSHRKQYVDEYDSHQPIPGERVVCPRKGTMTFMHSSIWHRVEPNESDVVRKNIFYAYCPAWVTPADRLQSDPAWLETLNREQRIIMRSYTNAYHNAKPPASDFPLFLDRETGLDRDRDAYRDDVALHRRKRRTWAEGKIVVGSRWSGD
ncbi:MAG: phytanoyl-CoA dioxygenase family protein [Gemmatimonadetes bacterium]|nr:phytanoyl-CoA dioxygenase family protein [Gemmatimonadota bacterium]